MSNNLEEKLLAVITESLPAAHIGVLRDYLQKAASNEKELARQVARNDDLSKRLDTSIEQYRQLAKLSDELQNEVASMKKQLENQKSFVQEAERRHRDAEITELAIKLGCAESRNKDFMDLMYVVFRNPQVRQTLTISERQMVAPENTHGYYSPTLHEKGRIERVETTETAES